MDELTKLQTECLDAILNIKTNFKKDSEARKTTPYLHTRLNRLEFLWSQFSDRDIEIIKLKETNPTHQYFIKNYFTEAEKHYEDIHNTLMKKLTEVSEREKQQPSATSKLEVPTQKGEDMNTEYPHKLLLAQQERFKLLHRVIESIKTDADKTHSTFYYQQKINTVQAYWDKITLDHTYLVTNLDTRCQEYANSNVYSEMEDMFQNIIIHLSEKLNCCKHSEDDIKLPRVVIPSFDGDYQNWTSFHDMFARLIHNNTKLSEVEKMQYLKTHVKKDAANLIQHLTISEVNYQTAWKLLNERYNNIRKLFSVQVQLLLNQPKIEQESAIAIRKLHDTTKECLHALKNLGVNTDDWAALIGHIVIQKLDFESHKLYEQSLEKPRELPTYETIFQFLENRFQSLESLRDSRKKDNRAAKPTDWPRVKTYHTNTGPLRCNYCRLQHRIYECSKFRALTTQERKNFIQTNKLCKNCLAHKEDEECRSKSKCNLCRQAHHTLLHIKQNTEVPANSIQSLLSKENRNVLLTTTLLKARTADGRTELLRALIDPGSQASFASEATAYTLGLPKRKAHAEISGIGLANSGTVKNKIYIQAFPRFSSSFSINIEALILPQLTKFLPNKRIPISQTRNLWPNMILADPTYDVPGPIDLIIGADVYHQIILEGVRKRGNGLLAQQTKFGWIVSGHTTEPDVKTSITCLVSFTELETTLKRFWELETTEEPNNELTEEDQLCEEHFQKTHKRNPDGTYTVKIPFKTDIQQSLGESKGRAMARLLQNEKRFTTNKTLEREYKLFMNEYMSLNHMVRAASTSHIGCYLPHQAVLKEESSTTKLRVVFDASSKTTTGISLNDAMYVGPKLQKDLADILLRWRKHRYALTADIEKMYRQIKIHEDDLQYQKVLWRTSNTQPIEEYFLTTVTYGTTAAPFLAMRTLQQLATDEKQNYPQAAQILLNDFYVDDLMTGADTFQEAVQIQKGLTNLLAAGGFTLRKWTTNHQRLLDTIPIKLRERGIQEITDGDTIKTLGVYWSPATDHIQFSVNPTTTDRNPTKRTVLAEIAKIFDPLGWLSPIIIQAKMLMQELWAAKLQWDTPLPPELSSQWNRFKGELAAVRSIKIYRWMRYTNHNAHKGVEIHGFCDASIKAYAAVVYSRIETSQGDIVVTMLAAKTKVAPLKKETTLPRLELCAAVLLSRLINKTVQALELQEAPIFAWTDSTITLAWIKGDTTRWKSFIAHRVNKIRSTISSEAWHHIKTDDNPADCASRGISPIQLKNHPLWWSGPAWLALNKAKWPIPPENSFRTRIEAREQPIAHLAAVNTNEVIERFSNLTHMVRVLTYCRRFSTYCKTKNKSTPNLTTKDLNATLIQIIRIVQESSFPQEIHQLYRSQQLEGSNKLRSLTPFLDNDKILRVGGRLDNSQLSYQEKHPIIIPHNHHLTTLILRDAHLKTLHGGNQLTHAYVLRKYWVIDARSAIRSIIYRCTTCCRYKAETSKQLMGKLPAPRVTPSKAFMHTGVDYAGPFNIRMSPGRGTKTYKGYIALFVCLSTKAIHLEAVGDMTTEAFLAAFKRFSSRRGFCSDLYSDCGTTFIGAKNELDRQFKVTVQKNQDVAAKTLVNNGTQWHFIPPATPHFGGLWEAGVKSVKHHLRRIAGELNFTYEEFTTLLCQIEACLNSRPLCPLNNEPNDMAVITPGHFLVGGPLLTPPEPSPPEKSLHLLKRMELICKLKNDFWKVWSSEYLSRLQQRPKWTKQHDDIHEGDLVLVTDEIIPPARWPLARVLKTYPGKDGLVRVVQVKTSKATLQRPITKLCRLPFDREELPPVEQQRQETIIEENRRPRKRSHTTIKPTNIPPRPPIDDLRRSHLPTKQPKKITASTTVASLLLLSLVLPVTPKLLTTHTGSIEGFVDIQQFQHNPGIYFEDLGSLHLVNNEWNTVVYYNLSTYYQQLKGFKVCMEKLAIVCNNTTLYNFYCNAIMTEIAHKVQELDHNNLILHDRHGDRQSRQRRAPFEIIGTLQKSLFGILDQEYANHIEQEINKLKDNENYLLHLAKNQTSITEITANVLKRTTAEIQKQFTVFNEHFTANMETLRQGEANNRIAQTFTAMTTYLNLIMNNYENMQKALIDILLDAHHGQISPHLLTPMQLKQQIQLIREHVPSSLLIPGEGSTEDLLNLYKIMTVKSRVTGGMIIFKIRIPLPTEGLFQLFKIHPIPTNLGSEFVYIEPSASYIAATLHRDSFYTLTRNEIKECIKTETTGLFCHQNHPVYTTHSLLNRCEMKLLNHQNFSRKDCKIRRTNPSQYWVQLEHRNHWIYVTDKELNINIVCGKRVIVRTLSKSGIIKLDKDCTIRHESMSISAQSIRSDHQHYSFLPQTNLSAIIPKLEGDQEEQFQPAPLIHLDTKALDSVKLDINKKFEPHLSNHHLHHYISTYLLAAIIIAALAWIVYHRSQPCKRKHNTSFDIPPVTPVPAARPSIPQSRPAE